MEKVAIVKCNSYSQEEVDFAIKKILKLLNFDLKKYKNILIKPNIAGAFEKNQEAITTHPSLVKSLLKQFKGKKIIGESSILNTSNAFEKAGYSSFNNLLVFESSKLSKVKDLKAKVLKEFYLSEKIKKSDLIINVPKLKTHILTKMTGAIKNLYGCIPGGIKAQYHRLAVGDEKFSKLLVDIFQNIQPELNVIDAVISMEGEGPSAGIPKKTQFILASKSAVALDIAVAKLIGYAPEKINVIKESITRNLYPNYKIEIIGDLNEIPNLKFKKHALEKFSNLTSLLIKLNRKDSLKIDRSKCIKCRLCAKKCPVGAIKMKPFPQIDEQKCIRCFCCSEVCPQHAISLKEILEKRIYRKLMRIYRSFSKKV